MGDEEEEVKLYKYDGERAEGETVSVTVRREFEEEAGNLTDGPRREAFRRLTDDLFKQEDELPAERAQRNQMETWTASQLARVKE